MLQPKSKTVFLLDYKEVQSLLPYMIPELDMSVFAREGNHQYHVEVTDDIIEVDEWIKEDLQKNPERCSVQEALSDYLSLACYREAIPPGDYFVAIFW